MHGFLPVKFYGKFSIGPKFSVVNAELPTKNDFRNSTYLKQGSLEAESLIFYVS